LTLVAGAVVTAACGLLVGLDPQFFWHDDNQIGNVPCRIDVWRALQAGELPLLTPYSWVMPTLLADYQIGVLSPIALVGVALAGLLAHTQAAHAAIYGTYMLALGAMGAFRVARIEGLQAPLAYMVSIVAALNGWSVAWGATNWTGAAAGFAATMWSWWGLSRFLRAPLRPQNLLLATLAIALLMTAGWPHTIFMTALITLWLGARSWARGGRWQASLGLLAPWMLGILLSAPAWLCFLELLPHTFRPMASGNLLQWQWLVPPFALLGLFLPTVVTAWDTFGTEAPHVPLELACGLIPAVAALWGLSRPPIRSRVRWELGLTLVLFALACLPSFGMFRWSFRWLPVAHVALALLGAQALQIRWQTLRHHEAASWVANPGVWGAVLVFLTHLASRITPVVSHALAGAYMGAAIAWAGAEEALRRGLRVACWAPAALTMGVFLVTYHTLPNGLAVPSWPLTEAMREIAPLRPGVRYLNLASKADYFPGGWTQPTFGPLTRPGMTPLIAGVEFINGYSAMHPKGPTATLEPGVHGYLRDGAIRRLLTTDSQPGGLLDRLGVDGLILSPHVAPLARLLDPDRWQLTSQGPDGMCFHRAGPRSPFIRAVAGVRYAELVLGARWWQALVVRDGTPAVYADSTHPAGTRRSFGARSLRLLDASRNGLSFEVGPGERPCLAAVMRAWVPGWVARLGGERLEVLALDGLATGIVIPARRSGTVELTYEPQGLLAGRWVAGAGLGLTLGALAWLVSRRRRVPKP
jgi:hypothetical protein